MTVKMKSQAFLQTSNNTLTSIRGQKHQINATLPLFKIQSKEQRCHPRTEYASIEKGQLQLSAKANSINRSQQRHQLKPSQVPKALPDTTEFVWNKVDNSFGMEESSIKGRQSSKLDHQQIEMMSRELSEKHQSSTKQQLDLSNKMCCPQLTIFASELNSKMQHLMKRMNSIEESNAYLKKNIERTNDENIQKMTRIAKLSEEKDELLAAREKWKNGKVQLEHLLVEVTAKIERQRKQQKQNMNKDDCQSYFKQKSKQKQPLNKPETKSKGSMLDRLRVRVERS